MEREVVSRAVAVSLPTSARVAPGVQWCRGSRQRDRTRSERRSPTVLSRVRQSTVETPAESLSSGPTVCRVRRPLPPLRGGEPRVRSPPCPCHPIVRADSTRDRASGEGRKQTPAQQFRRAMAWGSPVALRAPVIPRTSEFSAQVGATALLAPHLWRDVFKRAVGTRSRLGWCGFHHWTLRCSSFGTAPGGRKKQTPDAATGSPTGPAISARCSSTAQRDSAFPRRCSPCK